MRALGKWALPAMFGVWAMAAWSQASIKTAGQAREQGVLPVTLEISSSAGGFGQGRATRLTLRRSGEGYRSETTVVEIRRSDTPPHDVLPPETTEPVMGWMNVDKVRRLIEVMRLPPTTTVDASEMAPLDVWQADIDALWRPEKWAAVEEAHLAAQRYRERLRDPATLGMVLRDAASQFAVDLEVGVGVKAIFDDGSQLGASTAGHMYRMLPWRNADGAFSYSTNFADALLEILPADAVNRDALVARVDADKRQHLLKLGLMEINSNVDAIAQAPTAYLRLRQDYHLRAISIDDRASKEALMRDPRARGPQRLRVQLRRKGADRPVIAYVELNLRDGDLATPDDIERIERRFQRVASDGVLKSLPPRVILTFGYRYLTQDTYIKRDEALVRRQFVLQMAKGTRWRLDASSAAVSDAFVVSQGPLQWMLLGDGRTVRWKSSHGKPDAPGEWRCANVPLGSEMPDDGDPNLMFPNVCFGEMFDAEGRRIE